MVTKQRLRNIRAKISLCKSHSILRVLNWNITKMAKNILLSTGCLNTFLIRRNMVTPNDPYKTIFTTL
jgi:hypothetical protein